MAIGMREKTVFKRLAVLFAVIGLFALVTGIGGVEYAFKTGHWSPLEDISPKAARIFGSALLAVAVLFLRLSRRNSSISQG
jgi:hypothetical protein